MTRYLTKSKFRTALECPRKLFYLGKKEYVNTKLDDDFLKALAKGGFQVGELAKYYYPGGVNIETLDHEQALLQTEELLKSDCIIYEAAFRHEKLFIRSDILIRVGNRLKLIEVKSKSIDPAITEDSIELTNGKGIRSGWKPYIYDVAFQKYVIQNAHPEFEVTAHLLLVDKSTTATVDGLNQKFMLQNGKGKLPVKVVGDVSAAALGAKILIEIPLDTLVDRIITEEQFSDPGNYSFGELATVWADAHDSDTPLPANIAGKCGKCEFKTAAPTNVSKSGFHECWKEAAGFSDADFLKPSVLTLYNSRRKDDYITAGRYFLEDLSRADLEAKATARSDDGMSITDRQELQINKAKEKSIMPDVDAGGLKNAMRSWTFPLYFIDFETTAVAIPFNRGLRPYEQIAFQFSVHTMQADLTVEHRSQWINEVVGGFPNFEFVRKLRATLGDTGTIFRYATHENTILNAIYRQLQASQEPDREELCNWIKTITKSTRSSKETWEGERAMVDLKDLVFNYYYHPLTEGSNSIKDVLPAMLNTSEYLKSKYGPPIYGDEIRSLNHTMGISWIQMAGEIVKNPYELLPPVFEGFSETMLDTLILQEDAELADGGTAMIAYAQMQFTEMTEEERGRIRDALYRYCELDTLAMVMIVQEWMHLTK